MTGSQIFLGYLDSYCSQSEAPGFAVMIHGPWGSGKTHFVKNYISRSKEIKHFRYISLYGVSSAVDIDSAFLASLHYKCNNAIGRFVVTVLSGMVELFCRTNFSRALAEGLSADNSQNSFASKYLARIRRNIYIFDDVERAQMSLDETLGRINKLVEHVGCKVLIVSKTEFKDEPENAKKFEKIVGYSFRVIPEIKTLFEDIMISVQRSNIRDILRRNEVIVESIFQLSKHDNLRIIRRIVVSYLTVLEKIPAVLVMNTELMDALFREYLPIAYELKMGNLSEADVKGFERGQSLYIKGSDDTPWAKLTARYKGMLPERLLLLGVTWKKIICDGFVDVDAINDDLQTTVYGEKQKAPLWKRVLNIWDVTDQEFESIMDGSFRMFEAQELVVAEELLHIFSMLCYFEGQGIKFQDQSVECFAKQYIDSLVEKRVLISLSIKGEPVFGRHSYGGYVYLSDAPEYQSLRTMLLDGLNAIEELTLPTLASEWVIRFGNNPIKGMDELVVGHDSRGRFADIPLLKHVDEKFFVRTYVCQPPHVRREILSLLRARYEYAWPSGKVTSEGPWLKSVEACLQNELNERKGKISGLQLQNEYKTGFLKLANSVNGLDSKAATVGKG